MHRFLTAALSFGLACSAAAQEPKKLPMHFMPWYQGPAVRGYWGFHWRGPGDIFNPDVLAADGRPEVYSHYDPLIGPYDSMDPDVLECQMLQMKLAGVDGVIVDWYGLSNVFDYALNHEATEAIFDATAEFGLEFSVCFEDRTIQAQFDLGVLNQADIGTYMLGELLWMQANWFNAAHHTRIDGRPLLLNFGPVYVQTPGPWNTAFGPLNPRPLFFALHNLWTLADADGGFTWFHWDAWVGNPTEATIKARLNLIHGGVSSDPTKVIPSAVPGFKDIYEPGGRFPFLDHNNGETMRQSLEVAIDGPWQTIQIATWNDYGEGTMVEPTFEFGYTFLEVIQQERAEEIGPSFTFTPDDLRQPARLLGARRAASAPPETLDTVSDLLRNGQPAQARALLDLIEGGLELPAPSPMVVDAGGTLTFSTEIPGGGAGLSVRWFRDGVPLFDGDRVSGAATGTLTISPAVPDDSGSYELRISVGATAVVSPEAIGGVRQSGAGDADINGDGAVTPEDRERFIELVEDAGG
ncbi:MAG: hypothetical protein AAFR96_06305 [Planctomycetota bacterium]